MDLTEFRWQGFVAAQDGVSVHDNPYPAGCSEYDAWEEGWMECLCAGEEYDMCEGD